MVADLRTVLHDDDILVADVGVHKLWLATLFPTARPNSLMIANGLASMGIAVPGAVAAKLVHPERKVVAVTGDGGFLMNSQELETAKRLGTAFVTVIWTDNRYGIIALNQERRFGRTFGAALLRNGLPKPDTMISAYCSAICLVHSATSIRPCHGVFAMLVRFSAASHGSGIFDQNSVQCSKYCCLCRVCSSNRAVVSRKNAWTIFSQ